MFKPRNFLITALLLLLIAAISVYFGDLDSAISITSRWLTVICFCIYGIKQKSLTAWIFISMVIGIFVGIDFPEIAENSKVLSSIFLKMIKTVIAPLLFGTLVVGIAGHANLKQIGRMGIKSLIYFEIVTTIALFIGLAAINISGAGRGIKLPASTEKLEVTATKQTATDIILHIFPENIAKSVAEGQILQIVIFSIIFGIALAMVNDAKRMPVLEFAESLSEVMFKFTNIIMYFAPVGVGAAVAYTIAHMGFEVLSNLLQLLLTLYLALVAFILLVLVPVGLIIKLPFKKFIHAIAEPVSIAFATTSSESALPKAMEAMEKIGVPRKIVSFVMPTGYSFNLDGTTLYLSLASVFVAQAAGIEMSWSAQLVMVFTLMLTSKGVAGVPRASLVILLGTAASFNLPAEPIFVILAIDSLMDMARTSVNVIGNCLATVVIAKWENEFVEKD
ncbi:MAG: dicarboxylate/amino acid:cation symporter [Bacteroidota bacterium]|jgi:proton glutamate symport protein